MDINRVKDLLLRSSKGSKSINVLKSTMLNGYFSTIGFVRKNRSNGSGNRALQVAAVSFIGLFCFSAYSVASSSGANPTPKEKYEKMLKSEKAKYYEYLEAINKSGNQLTPTQLRAIQAYKAEIDRIKNEQPVMKSERQTILYNVDNPPTVVIGKSRLSTITFVDSAGNPYPIQSFVVSNSKEFNVTQRNQGSGNDISLASESEMNEQNQGVSYNNYLPGSHKKDEPKPVISTPKKVLPPSMFNSLTIKGNTDYANGDMIVYLVGKQSAIHIFLRSSDSSYDYQTNVSIDGLTAQSLASVSASGVSTSQPTQAMMEFLNGTPPRGAKSLNISLENSQVWQLGDYFYIRTMAELQSPAWLSRVATASGYKVFKVTDDSHVVTMVANGRRVMAYINSPSLVGGLS